MSEIKIKKEDLKKIFTGYRTLTKSVRKSLECRGFSVSTAGKHNKLYYGNKLVAVFPKTSSDGYGSGRCLVSEIWSALPDCVKG